MAQYVINTTDAYTKCVVDYTSELVGTWPRLYIRVNYKMFIRLTAYGSWYINGCVFDFGGKKTTFTLNFSAGSGGGESAYLVRDYVDLPVSGNSPTFSVSPSVGISTSVWSGRSNIPVSQTVPDPYSYGINYVTPENATSAYVNYRFKDNYGFYRIQLRMMPGSLVYNPPANTTSGAYTVTDLKPDTDYKAYVDLIDRGGTVRITDSRFVSFRTLVDQLRVWIKQGGVVKKALVWVKKDGKVQKVTKAYVRQGNSLKPVKGA